MRKPILKSSPMVSSAAGERHERKDRAEMTAQTVLALAWSGNADGGDHRMQRMRGKGRRRRTSWIVLLKR
jgi:hypothetical protein